MRDELGAVEEEVLELGYLIFGRKKVYRLLAVDGVMVQAIGDGFVVLLYDGCRRSDTWRRGFWTRSRRLLGSRHYETTKE